MTQAEAAKLLGLPLLEYQKVEIDISTKYDSYIYRKALNTSWKEFYIYETIFEGLIAREHKENDELVSSAEKILVAYMILEINKY